MHMLEQHMGQDHVSAQDQADENMAQFGSGTYLTKYKDAYPTVEMTSANQLTIGTGSMLVNGRHCIIDTPEVLTVNNGSSGMTERDLVCVHWKEVEAKVQAASGNGTQTITKEEVDLVIVKGTPASSGATDPKISQDTIRSGVGEAWVPFARITKDGLTPSVAFTVDKMAPESEFRDSISPVSVECNLNTNAQGQKIKLSKVGKLVTMSIGGTQLKSNLVSWGSRQIATIPVGFRPKDEKIYAALCTDNGVAAIRVENKGVLSVASRKDALTAKLDLFAGASWVTD